MEATAQETLWILIKVNMGDNSLKEFRNFYREETIEQQFDVVYGLFNNMFGKAKADEMLLPAIVKIKQQGSPL